MALRPRRVCWIGCLVVLSAVVSGCVSLPDSSSVDPANGSGVELQQGVIRYAPPGPRSGARAEEIVSGYIQAMLAFPRDPGLVREFLTPTAGRAWNPGQQLLVYENQTLTHGTSGTVGLKASVLGSLDPRGSWVSAIASDDTLDVKLILDKVDGQWRINNPPSGTLLDTDFFDRYYHQYSLYYFDPTHTLLAADPVFELLGSPSHTATALVQNLLLGPTLSMVGIVDTEAPITTEVEPGVTVSPSGLARIPLSSQIRSLSPTSLNLFAAQLAWTLRQERLSVKRVELTVGGQVLAVPGLSKDFSVSSFDGYDPAVFGANRTLFALADGHLRSVTSLGVLTAPGPIGTLVTKARSAAIDPHTSRAALVVDGGTEVVVGGLSATDEIGNATWFSGGVDLLKPSWDARGLLWLVDRTAGNRAVVRVVTRKTAKVVDVPGLTGENVRAFAVSRDGMRLAAIIGQGSAAQLVIGAVQRDASSRLDVSFTGVQRILNSDFPLVDITQLAWSSPTTVAVLAKDAGSELQPYDIAIDGSRVQPTIGFLPVRPFSLAAGANTDVQTVIGTDDGRLYIRTPDQTWAVVPATTQLFAPVYPG